MANKQGWVSLGFYGTGTLWIENGGTVVSEVGALATGGSGAGQQAGNATAIIAGDGSSWTLTGTFHIGGYGTGTLKSAPAAKWMREHRRLI
ncbi:hypothetical protein [Phyllobacterium phragmitis]|uniref:hypothetical protein n=1 Tax=Phyllobacterium phragmitis TaxID=2670329 RepID=UPI0038B24354